MTKSTGVKEEMHCHSGVFSYFGTIKQQGGGGGGGVRSVHMLPSAPWKLPSSAKGGTSEMKGVTRYLDKF